MVYKYKKLQTLGVCSLANFYLVHWWKMWISITLCIFSRFLCPEKDSHYLYKFLTYVSVYVSWNMIHGPSCSPHCYKKIVLQGLNKDMRFIIVKNYHKNNGWFVWIGISKLFTNSKIQGENPKQNVALWG